MNYKACLIFSICIIFICCSENQSQKNVSEEKPGAETPVSKNGNVEQGGNGIVGEWEQIYTCFDKNGNYKLEPEEKKPSDTHLGFSWFRFNADGSCLRDKDVQFKGTYEVQEKNGTRKLMIHGGDNIRYSINELTEKELVLGNDGAFMIFKRI